MILSLYCDVVLFVVFFILRCLYFCILSMFLRFRLLNELRFSVNSVNYFRVINVTDSVAYVF